MLVFTFVTSLISLVIALAALVIGGQAQLNKSTFTKTLESDYTSLLADVNAELAKLKADLKNKL